MKSSLFNITVLSMLLLPQSGFSQIPAFNKDAKKIVQPITTVKEGGNEFLAFAQGDRDFHTENGIRAITIARANRLCTHYKYDGVNINQNGAPVTQTKTVEAENVLIVDSADKIRTKDACWENCENDLPNSDRSTLAAFAKTVFTLPAMAARAVSDINDVFTYIECYKLVD